CIFIPIHITLWGVLVVWLLGVSALSQKKLLMYLSRGVLLLLFFNSLCCSMHAESGVAASSSLSSKLERYSRLTYPQKLYLQTDRELYFSGETIWFSAWLTHANSFLPDRLEKILY